MTVERVEINTTTDGYQTTEELQAALDALEAARGNPADTQETASEELILGQFKTQADLEKAYTELRTKMSQGKPAEEPSESVSGLSIEEAQDAASDAGLSLPDLAAKYAETGALDDTDYEALEKSGITRDVVDAFIEGQKALTARYEEQVLADFGGREAYSKMTEWAKANWSKEKIAVFNKAVESRNIDEAQIAISGLRSAYQEANGSGPARVIDATPGSTQVGFASTREMVQAMKDPRYLTDPVYQAAVEQKALRSAF